jgi:uncharacterized membrane protein YhaH (DUF805 family)
MNIIWLLFSFQGRIGRLAFLGALIVMIVASLAFTLGTAAYMGAPLPPKSPEDFRALAQARSQLLIPNLLWMAFLYWIHFAISAKRLHDIGRSGWLNLKIFLAFAGAGFVAGIGMGMHVDAVIMVGGGLVVLVGLYALWIALLQFFKRGDEDANDYGDPPGAGGKTQMERVVRVFDASPTPAPHLAALAAGGGGFGKRRA